MFSATKGGSPSGYQISRSVRLRSSASAYFNRTPASAGNQRTWTISFWTKINPTGNNVAISANNTFIRFGSTIDGNTITVNHRGAGATNYFLISTAVYRDPSAWYHVVWAVDTTQATPSDRSKIYVNGVQITSFSTANYPPQNQDTSINLNAVVQSIGNASTTYTDGYYTEFNLIDGQALTPSSFGETNPITGVWQPKKYAGTYGTNGFYLNFSDNSAATAAAIGKDYSGNGNNWTPNNISVTAGVTYDSMLDVPTQWADGGNGRGNYCTLNPLVTSALSGGGTLSNGNLRIAGTVSVSNAYARGTMALSGKFYAEFFFDVVNATASIGVDAVTATTGALNTSSTSVSYRSGGNKRVLGTESAYGASWVANDIIGVAVDTTANTVEFFKNGVSQGVITSSAFFAQGDCVFAMAKDDIGSPTGYANFGQRPFAYTPPTGFKALNTLNLPTPTILKGNQYFDATLYTGNGTGITVTNSGSMQPDFVWAKNRSNVADHALYDTLRTAMLSSNTTAAEVAASNVVSYNSNGFTISGGDSRLNANGNTYVGWQWKEGATQGFDIVTYTGDGTSPRNIAHSLGVAPSMVIVKSRSAVASWMVKHKNLSSNNNLFLEGTNAQLSPGNGYIQDLNNSSTFGVVNGGGGVANINANGTTYVAYLFAEVAGFSRFGSYTGNGSADGPFVFCGFRPRFILWKKTTGVAADWDIIDTSRNVGNIANSPLYPNLSSAETTVNKADILSNGFKLRTTSTDSNVSGETYIFAAFAENPFKNALAR